MRRPMQTFKADVRVLLGSPNQQGEVAPVACETLCVCVRPCVCVPLCFTVPASHCVSPCLCLTVFDCVSLCFTVPASPVFVPIGGTANGTCTGARNRHPTTLVDAPHTASKAPRMRLPQNNNYEIGFAIDCDQACVAHLNQYAPGSGQVTSSSYANCKAPCPMLCLSISFALCLVL